jgi:hypothetical protein
VPEIAFMVLVIVETGVGEDKGKSDGVTMGKNVG